MEPYFPQSISIMPSESKFENLVIQYERCLVGESQFPQLSNLGSTSSTATSATSGVDAQLNTDPAVKNAKVEALKKIQTSITKN